MLDVVCRRGNNRQDHQGLLGQCVPRALGMKNVGTLGLDLASVIALERQEMGTFISKTIHETLGLWAL